MQTNEVNTKTIDQLKKEIGLLEEYAQRKKDYGMNNLVAWKGETVFNIGNYSLAKLTTVDDIYNNAYVEMTTLYIIDKNKIPHLLCTTNSGNANHNSSSIEEINHNQKAADTWYNALAILHVGKKGLKSLTYKNKIAALEDKIDALLNSDRDLTTLDIGNDFPEKVTQNFVKQFEENRGNLNKKREVTSVRTYLTQSEFFGSHRSSDNEREL